MDAPGDPLASRASATWITRLDPSLDLLARPDGVRVAVKDCIDLGGTITTAGSLVLAETAEVADADAPCLAGFRSAGARILGKANLHELCFGSTGVNDQFGTPVNPLDPRRIPGGSSSGSAVAVASDEVEVGIGTDTAGSIRNPAACCGIMGLKPTFGVVPVEGVRPLAPSLDTVGVLARTVAGVAQATALLDDRLVDQDLAATATVGRIRLPDTDPTIDAAIDSALLEAGLELIEITLPGWDIAHAAALTVLFGEALIVNDDLWRHHHDRLGRDLVERFTFAQAISPAELGDARAQREPWRLELAEVLGSVGVLALPTMVEYPARVGDHPVAPNPACPAINLAGLPALAMPVPSGGLLPASLQLVAPDHHEHLLLGTAAVIEDAVG